MENDLCGDDPWLVLHKIDSPTKMRYIGNRVQVWVPLAPKVSRCQHADVTASST